MASEDEYLAALLHTIRSTRWGNDCPGMNSDIRVDTLELKIADDGVEDLVASVSVRDRRWRPVGSVRMPFGRDVRELSGLEDPRQAAVQVVRAIDRQVAALVHPQDGGPVGDVGLDDDRILACWDALRAVLRGHGSIQETPDALVVQEDGGSAVTVHLQPRSWARLVGGVLPEELDEGLGWYDLLDVLLLTRGDDEAHLVLFRGELHRSVRATLPPIPRRPSAGEWTTGLPS